MASVADANTATGNGNRWNCPLCTYIAPQKFTPRQRNNHLRVHTGERPYQCQLCEKNYKTSAQLTVHHKMTHTGRPKLKCLFCDMSFFYEGHLRRHVFYHTKEKPYICRTCGQEFIRRPQMLVHQLSHKKPGDSSKTLYSRRESGVKPFSCNLCGGQFSEYSLVKHECTGRPNEGQGLGYAEALTQLQFHPHSANGMVNVTTTTMASSSQAMGTNGHSNVTSWHDIDLKPPPELHKNNLYLLAMAALYQERQLPCSSV